MMTMNNCKSLKLNCIKRGHRIDLNCGLAEKIFFKPIWNPEFSMLLLLQNVWLSQV